MFQTDIQNIVVKGVISLMTKQVAKRTKYYGNRIEDCCALIATIGKSSFFEEEYDKSLETVSAKWGVGFETTYTL